jgi:Flp pilus assembly protein TadG
MMLLRHRRRVRDRGSLALELAILTPVLLALLAVMVAIFLVEQASGVVDSAARAAARSATLVRDPDEAHAQAEQAAEEAMESSGVTCSTMTVTVDTSEMSAPLGETGWVEVRVECTVPLSHIAPGLPGSVERASSFVSVVDQFRERS